MADATDFMTFLNEHQGSEVMIEVGMPADDLDHHSRRLAKYHGRLGPMRDIDDADRPGRAIGWVPIGDEDGDRPLMGFFLEADRVVEATVNSRGGMVRFVDQQYLSVVLRSIGRSV
jgi:hypothetical protein